MFVLVAVVLVRASADIYDTCVPFFVTQTTSNSSRNSRGIFQFIHCSNAYVSVNARRQTSFKAKAFHTRCGGMKTPEGEGGFEAGGSDAKTWRVNADEKKQPQPTLFPFAIVSITYILFTITDGAVRMIVLLHLSLIHISEPTRPY